MKKIALLLGIALMGASLSAVASDNIVVNQPVTITVNPAENIDKLLNEFDKAANDYIKAVKKFKGENVKQDQSILKLKKKVETVKRRLETLEEDMTPAQLKRYKKILQKLALIEE